MLKWMLILKVMITESQNLIFIGAPGMLNLAAEITEEHCTRKCIKFAGDGSGYTKGSYTHGVAARYIPGKLNLTFILSWELWLRYLNDHACTHFCTSAQYFRKMTADSGLGKHATSSVTVNICSVGMVFPRFVSSKMIANGNLMSETSKK